MKDPYELRVIADGLVKQAFGPAVDVMNYAATTLREIADEVEKAINAVQVVPAGVVDPNSPVVPEEAKTIGQSTPVMLDQSTPVQQAAGGAPVEVPVADPTAVPVAPALDATIAEQALPASEPAVTEPAAPAAEPDTSSTAPDAASPATPPPSTSEPAPSDTTVTAPTDTPSSPSPAPSSPEAPSTPATTDPLKEPVDVTVHIDPADQANLPL